MVYYACFPQVLLDLASLILEEQQSLEVLLRKIAGTILSFMLAQGCTVFIADGDVMVSSHTHARTQAHTHTHAHAVHLDSLMVRGQRKDRKNDRD